MALVFALASEHQAAAEYSAPSSVILTFASPSGSDSGYEHATVLVRYTFGVCLDRLAVMYSVDWSTLKPGSTYILDGKRIDAGGIEPKTPANVNLTAEIHRGGQTIGSVYDNTAKETSDTGCTSAQVRTFDTISSYFGGKAPSPQELQSFLDSLDMTLSTSADPLVNPRLAEAVKARDEAAEAEKKKQAEQQAAQAAQPAPTQPAAPAAPPTDAANAKAKEVAAMDEYNRLVEERAKQDREQQKQIGEMVQGLSEIGQSLAANMAARAEEQREREARHRAYWTPICEERRARNLGETTFYLGHAIWFNGASLYCFSGEYQGYDAFKSRDVYTFTVTKAQKYRIVLYSKLDHVRVTLFRDDADDSIGSGESDPHKGPAIFIDVDLKPGDHQLIVRRNKAAFQDASKSFAHPYYLRIIAAESCWMNRSRELDSDVVRGRWSEATCRIQGRPAMMFRLPDAGTARQLAFQVTSHGSAPGITVLAHGEGLHPKQEVAMTDDGATANLYDAGIGTQYVLVTQNRDGDDAYEMKVSTTAMPYPKHGRHHFHFGPEFMLGHGGDTWAPLDTFNIGFDVGAQIRPRLGIAGVIEVGVGGGAMIVPEDPVTMVDNSHGGFALIGVLGVALLKGAERTSMNVTAGLSPMMLGGDTDLGGMLRIGFSSPFTYTFAVRPYVEVRRNFGLWYGAIGIGFGRIPNFRRVQDEW